MPRDTAVHPPTNLSDGERKLQAHLDHLEGTLQDLTAQVRRLQRLASLGTLSLTLAHEFNNLLTPIAGGAQFALSCGEPETMKKSLEQTLLGARRLAELCDRLLGMGTDRASGPVPAPVAPIAREAVDCLLRDLARDSITLEFDVPDDLKAGVRPGDLHQVFLNLFLNARQAMAGQSGILRIAARALDAATIEIEVVDTGCGISPENLPRIFEPFFSTKTGQRRLDRGGVGLGLHVCRQLVHDMSGTIQATSRIGQGTTMTLTLPSGNPGQE